MAKYIEREALIEWLKRIPLKDLSDGRGLCRVVFEDDFKKAIKNMPKTIIADVSPVRHGRWLYGDYYDIGDVCSECFWDSQMVQPSYRYCPNCGAKMYSEDDNGEEKRASYTM